MNISGVASSWLAAHSLQYWHVVTFVAPENRLAACCTGAPLCCLAEPVHLGHLNGFLGHIASSL